MRSVDNETRELLKEIVDAYWRWDAATVNPDIAGADAIEETLSALVTGMADAVEEIDAMLIEDEARRA